MIANAGEEFDEDDEEEEDPPEESDDGSNDEGKEDEDPDEMRRAATRSLLRTSLKMMMMMMTHHHHVTHMSERSVVSRGAMINQRMTLVRKRGIVLMLLIHHLCKRHLMPMMSINSF